MSWESCPVFWVNRIAGTGDRPPLDGSGSGEITFHGNAVRKWGTLGLLVYGSILSMNYSYSEDISDFFRYYYVPTRGQVIAELIGILFVFIFLNCILWRILTRMGYSQGVKMCLLVGAWFPPTLLIGFVALAFVRWPLLRENRQLRKRVQELSEQVESLKRSANRRYLSPTSHPNFKAEIDNELDKMRRSLGK